MSDTVNRQAPVAALLEARQARITAVNLRRQATDATRTAVAAARADGWTWPRIAANLNLTRQALYRYRPGATP